MANHPSAEKRNRQRIVATERNRAAKSALRGADKKARAAVASGDAAKAKSGTLT
ncbi:MAG TPA: 30S ribosomal protein S20, partial [Polyangiaceae bacterium]|nr:30S ribosomal protein S20 [Polyangiaceae bacterium]